MMLVLPKYYSMGQVRRCYLNYEVLSVLSRSISLHRQSQTSPTCTITAFLFVAFILLCLLSPTSTYNIHPKADFWRGRSYLSLTSDFQLLLKEVTINKTLYVTLTNIIGVADVDMFSELQRQDIMPNPQKSYIGVVDGAKSKANESNDDGLSGLP